MKISSIMSPSARRISTSASLQEALELMKLHDIRHLPVIDRDDVIGVISENDLKLGISICETRGHCPTVGEIARPDPLIVSTEDDASSVAKEMAEKKYDCALVADQSDNFVGIVTTTDICRLLHLLLEEQKRP